MIEDILFKILTGQPLAKAEQLKLDIWLEEEPKNKDIYVQLKLTFLATPHANKQTKREVWRKIERAKLSKSVTRDKSNTNLFVSVLKYAAVIFLVSTSVWSILELNTADETQIESVSALWIEKESLPGQKLSFKLPDGSFVKLNAGSKITFPEHFDSFHRTIKLTGEAFFDIEKDSLRPFKILTPSSMSVEVLGTSFLVKAYDKSSESIVAVKTGRVAVLSPDQEVKLSPHEMVIYDKEKQALISSEVSVDDAVFAWMDQNLVFEQSNFAEIIKNLELWYGKSFEIMITVNNKKLYSGRFTNPTLKEVLESLSYAYEFNFRIEKNKVLIE